MNQRPPFAHRAVTRFPIFPASALLLASLLSATAASATMYQIKFTGLDVMLSNGVLQDAASMDARTGDIADADEVFSADFFVDNAPVGSLNSGVSGTELAVDLLLSPVTGLMFPAGSGIPSTADAGSGFFDLLIEPGGAGILLDVDAATISLVIEDSGLTTLEFVFLAGTAAIENEDLPFFGDIDPNSPVSVSFSSQGMDSLTESSGVITSFRTSGTGEINIIPEPGTLLLLSLGLVGLANMRRLSS